MGAMRVRVQVSSPSWHRKGQTQKADRRHRPPHPPSDHQAVGAGKLWSGGKRKRLRGGGVAYVGMTLVANRMMRMMMMATMTQMMAIILTFFHQYLRATFCEVVLKCSDWEEMPEGRGG